MILTDDVLLTYVSEHPECLVRLDDRRRSIFERRHLSRTFPVPTLRELGKEFGVSNERIRQLESQAFMKLRRVVLDALA